MDVAAGWYASGTFWTGAGTVVGVLGAVAVVWVTLTVGFPRRRLYYSMQAVAPLITAPEGIPGNLELRNHGNLLADPRALTIQLISQGRKDIPNDAYNDGQPLRLNVGSPVVEVLRITSEPESLPKPKVTVDGTFLNIGPSLIGRRHKIIISVLTDGGEPSLTCQSPLIDVQVRRRLDITDDILSLGKIALRLLLLALLIVVRLVTAHFGKSRLILLISLADLVVCVPLLVSLFRRIDAW